MKFKKRIIIVANSLIKSVFEQSGQLRRWRRIKPAFLLIALIAASASAPIFSATPYTGVQNISDTTGSPSARGAEIAAADEAYFDPADFEVIDYTRADINYINRSLTVESEDLLFGSASDEDFPNGIKAPPDMTFIDDKTDIYVHSTILNMRSLPTTDASIMRTFKLGDKFTRTGIGSEWDRIIDSEGVIGYVFNEYVDTTKPSPTPTPVPKFTAPAKANTLGGSIALEVQKYIGVRYRMAYADPNKGFDCSGLTWYVYNRYGISTPRGTSSYANAGTKIPYSQIAPGDIIAWDTNDWDGRRTITHVSIYIGDGMMVHASSSLGKVVKVSVAQYKLWEDLVSVHRFTAD